MLSIPAILSYYEAREMYPRRGCAYGCWCCYYCCCFRNFIRLFSVLLISKYFAVCIITRGISSIALHSTHEMMLFYHPHSGRFYCTLSTEHVCIHTGPLVLLVVVVVVASVFHIWKIGTRFPFTMQSTIHTTTWLKRKRANERKSSSSQLQAAAAHRESHWCC